jgi:AraC-like DNA-binding protein
MRLPVLGNHAPWSRARLASTRRDLALRYLEDGKLSQQEIAFVLGFSEQSAFQHAFARWTGRSPGAYRAQRARRDHTAP